MAGHTPIPWAGGDVPVIGVWDARDPDGPWERHIDRCARWVTTHMAPVRSDAFRAEFTHLDGVPAVICYRYARDPDTGHWYDDGTGRPVQAQPVVLALDELPPADLFT